MSERTAESWDETLDALQGHGRLPSIVAGVLRGGELVWSGAAGVTPGVEVQYRIGSITKTFAAVAILQCRDEGLLSLDDPVGRHVPEAPYAEATVRDLLSHVSGMQSEPAGPWWERSPGVDWETLCRRNSAAGAVAGAGEWFHYSNLGFAVLGRVLDRLRGVAWWEVVEQRITTPLGLTRTSYQPDDDAAPGYSVDHFAGTLRREPHQNTGAMAPAGQLWSTVGDLARWAAFLRTGHPDVLSSDTLREMAQPRDVADDYGLGLALVEVEGRTLVGHTGSMPGFIACCFIDRDSGDGVVALANATTGMAAADVPGVFLGAPDPSPVEPWTPTTRVPDRAGELLGLWFWGNTAYQATWHNETLRLRTLAVGKSEEIFDLEEDRIVGTSGYHRGETLHVVRRHDGELSHLECATFVYTRQPYHPGAPIPGGL